MRHEYENGKAKEVMTFRDPTIPTFLEVMAEQKAANIAFYNDTELGRTIGEFWKENPDATTEEWGETRRALFKAASLDDAKAFHQADLGGLGVTLGLLETLEVDGVEIEDALNAVLKNSNRRRELQNAHAKMFEDDGA